MTKPAPQNPAAETAKPKGRRTRLGAEAALAKAAFDSATTPANRELLQRDEAVVVVVQVPSQSWVTPISGPPWLADARRQKDRARRIAEDQGPALRRQRPSACRARRRPQRDRRQPVAGFVPAVGAHQGGGPDDPRRPAGRRRADARHSAVSGRPRPDESAEGSGRRSRLRRDRCGACGPDRRRRRSSEDAAKSGQGTLRRPTAPRRRRCRQLEEAVFYGQAREWGLALAIDVEEAKKSGDWSGVDRGACFYGPPGTGERAFLCRIIAAACRLPLIEASVADLFASSAGYLDSVIKAQRAVFAKAARVGALLCPMGRDVRRSQCARSKLSPRGRRWRWWLPVVDDFLMGVSNAPRNVIFLGCTNHLDLVEEGLLRPDRMERAVIEIKAPDECRRAGDDPAGFTSATTSAPARTSSRLRAWPWA